MPLVQQPQFFMGALGMVQPQFAGFGQQQSFAPGGFWPQQFPAPFGYCQQQCPGHSASWQQPHSITPSHGQIAAYAATPFYPQKFARQDPNTPLNYKQPSLNDMEQLNENVQKSQSRLDRLDREANKLFEIV